MKMVRRWLITFAFAAPSAFAELIIQYPVDESVGAGWTSQVGELQVAEDFAISENSTINQVSWYGYSTGIIDAFDILFFEDFVGQPRTSAFASESVSGLTGIRTGIKSLRGPEILELSASIAPLTLDPGDYWISIRGSSSSSTGFIWSHATTDGSGNLYGRRTDDGDWEEFDSVGVRDRQSLKLAIVEDIDEPASVPAPGSLLLLGAGLFSLWRSSRYQPSGLEIASSNSA